MTLTKKAQKISKENPMLVISGGITFELAEAYLKLRKVLEWYADRNNWRSKTSAQVSDFAEIEMGQRAREVLKETE